MGTKWTYEKLKSEALKYNSKADFIKKSSNAYIAIQKRKLIKDLCSHMTQQKRPKGYWTLETLQKEALKYKTKKEFKEKSPTYFSMAQKRKILDQISKHMVVLHKKWSLEEIKKEALKYKTRIEFYKNSSAYHAAIKRKILDEVCAHMKFSTNHSDMERSLLKIIKEKYPKAQHFKDRRVQIKDKPLIQGFDIDIYIPELRKGVEFDGEYFHSLKGLKRGRPNWPENDLENYHQIKDEYFALKGIEILHIKEKEWLNDQEKQLEIIFDFLAGTKK